MSSESPITSKSAGRFGSPFNINSDANVSYSSESFEAWKPAKAYTSSGRMGPAAPWFLALMTVVSSLISMVIYHYILNLLNIFLITPIIGGLIVGLLVAIAVKPGHCRRFKFAAACGAIGGVLTYGGDLVLDTIDQRPIIVQRAVSLLSIDQNVPIADATQVIEQYLTPLTTFKVVMQSRADAGVSIVSQSGSNASGIPIRGMLFYVLMVVEIVLVAGSAAGIAGAAAASRYCEDCGCWHRSQVAFKVSELSSKNLLGAIETHEWDRAAAIASNEKVKTAKSWCTVSVERCPRCHDGLIRASQTEGKEVTSLYSRFLPAKDVEQLLALGRLKN